MLALRRLISLQSKLDIKKKLFDAAFWITIATLFYFWSMLFFALVIVALIYYSQNDIKLDVADALVIRSLEFSYENYLNENSSFGISALFNLAKQSVDFRYNENMMITPYYHH